MLRKVIFISTMCFILIFNSVHAFAQDIPNGIEPRKLTATVEEERPGSFPVRFLKELEPTYPIKRNIRLNFIT